MVRYETEEKIVFKVRNYCYIQERDERVVIHGIISKRVIEVQGVRIIFYSINIFDFINKG